MKIQLASDLHLDVLGESRRDWTIIQPERDADILVLAGDIDSGPLALERFRDWPVPILYLSGNHEFYRHNWPNVRGELQRQSLGSEFHVLDNQRLDIGGVRFLGCTLWTDFMLDSRWKTHAMRQAHNGMNDFRLIATPTGIFMPEDSVTDHQASRRWLEEALSEPFD